MILCECGHSEAAHAAMGFWDAVWRAVRLRSQACKLCGCRVFIPDVEGK
jgi:hypothetical protein